MPARAPAAIAVEAAFMPVDRSPGATCVPVGAACYFIAAADISGGGPVSAAPNVTFSGAATRSLRGTCLAALIGVSAPLDFPVVLIVASRGGLAAISRVLASFPKDFPAAVVIVQHRAELPGLAWEHIVERMTPMRVRGIVPGEHLEPGIVYVAPATTHVSISPQGYLKVTDGERIRGVLSSANPLFESAGAHLGRRTIAVVLTGWGRDATDGVQAVKHGGGIVIAQDERSSVDFGMPGSAIATGTVDYVRSIEDIGPLIVDLVNQHSVAT